MKSFVNYTKSSFVKELHSKDKYDAIEELARVFNNSDICNDIEVLVSALKDRERIMSTGIGFGIAVPHAKIKDVNRMAFAIGIAKDGIEFDSIDGDPVRIIILVAAGEGQHKDYLMLLSGIMSILKIDEIKEQIINSTSPEEVMGILSDK